MDKTHSRGRVVNCGNRQLQAVICSKSKFNEISSKDYFIVLTFFTTYHSLPNYPRHSTVLNLCSLFVVTITV